MRNADPGPPCLVGTTAVNDALAGDGNVGLPIGINAGREVEAVEALPRGLYDGIEVGLESEEQRGPLLDMQIDMALQMDSCGKECLTSRYDNPATTFLSALVDSFLYGFLVIGSRCVRPGAKLRDKIIFATDLRYLNALFYLLVDDSVPLVGLHRKGGQQG